MKTEELKTPLCTWHKTLMESVGVTFEESCPEGKTKMSNQNQSTHDLLQNWLNCSDERRFRRSAHINYHSQEWHITFWEDVFIAAGSGNTLEEAINDCFYNLWKEIAHGGP